MTYSSELERGYRRLLAFYPGAFRREHEQEMLAVLMDGAQAGQRRPGRAESADLVRSALRARLRPASRPPRTVAVAVRLMCLGAALELGAMITILATTADVKSALIRAYPHLSAAQWHAVVANRLLPDEIGAPIVACLWLFMAWGNGRGSEWARVVFVVLFGLTSLGLLVALSQSAAIYAPADLIAGAVLWLVQLAVTVLIFSRQSSRYFGHEPA
jgi:hypothetical protein